MIIESLLRPALFLAETAENSGGFFQNRPLWRVINLVVFVLILLYILRNKIGLGRVFDNRAATIVKELEQARQEKQEAETRLAELESRLGRLDREIAEIRAESERESARESERIAQSAAADAEKIRQAAHREIEGAVKAARTELRAFVAEASVDMAQQMISREIRPEDNARMVNKYIDELGEVNR